MTVYKPFCCEWLRKVFKNLMRGRGFEPPKALSHWISTAGTLVRLRSKCAASFFGFLGAFLSAEKERMPLKSNPFEPMSDARSNFTYSRQPSFDRLGTPAQIRLCAVVLKSIGCSSA